MQNTKIIRPPVIAILGHIDHGKSTILSYIRKSTKELNEAGGITQHISAYEVEHIDENKVTRKITFLDTPGHEAFSGIRTRGAVVADIVVLVVSAEDGVKPQTLEALKSIKKSGCPFIVAINKIDKPDANVERTKQSLAENEVYVEGYGGDIPVVEVSGKIGTGISELLDMIILVADMASLTGDPTVPASGIVIESNRDIQKGISSSCVIKNGTLKKGMYVVAGKSSAPIRIMQNFLGKPIDSATFSSPVKIIGWDVLPEVGIPFQAFETRDQAFAEVAKELEKKLDANNHTSECCSENMIPCVIKADTGGSLEAVLQEIKKLETERIGVQVISSGIGAISENDVRLANGTKKGIVIGFNVKVDNLAKHLAERNEIEVKTFDVIYKMSEWLSEVLIKGTPKMTVTEMTGQAKILKVFSRVKDKQIVGGSVQTGSISVGSNVKIKRKDVEICEGKIRGLEQQKNKTDSVAEGVQFGAMIEAKLEIAPGDTVESFVTIEK